MSDEPKIPEWDGISRRNALRWLLATPIQLGLMSSTLLGQVAKPTGLKIITPTPVQGRPRILLTSSGVEALRQQLASNAAFRERWQTAITEFESDGGQWSKSDTGWDAYNRAFAAFLTLVRRPNNDLGLTWRSSWQQYRDRIVTDAAGWDHTGNYCPQGIGTSLVYDTLYNDLTEAERQTFSAWNTAILKKIGWLGYGSEVYDNGNSDDHAMSVFSSLAADDFDKRLPSVYAATSAVAMTNDWMGYGFGLGREWHDGYPSRPGLMFQLMALRNAGYPESATTGLMLTHMRDGWQLVRQATQPHPSADVSPWGYWSSDKFHTQDTLKMFHRQLNVASHMLWALAVLPGKVQMNAAGMSDQPALANSEAAYFGYLRTVFDEPLAPRNDDRLRNILNFKMLGVGSSTAAHGMQNTFWSFPAWLIYNAQEHAPITAEAAGIPLVRRWWPGTLDWTFIRSSHSRTIQSVISYRHRRYGSSNYEEGCRQNGSWTVHRDGPLLIQRGTTGHSFTVRRATWGANGAVTFVDHGLYQEFEYSNSDEHDVGCVRAVGGNGDTKEKILASGPGMDFGPVSAWYADAKVVAITSDLTRSYNSSLVRTGNPEQYNQRKISAFTREFVTVRRGADGTDNEKVFTYDRIRLLDTKFQPRYNLCPATQPNIDGTETPHTPWGPVKGDGRGWYATGPTRWDYTGATRLIYDNVAEPQAPIPGNGKVCVTWLQPSGGNVAVQKLGGTNGVDERDPKATGDPNFDPWNAWHPRETWVGLSSLDARAYVGLYTVSISPTPVTPDTRFLVACEVMAAGATPGTATELQCDPQSVAARCGASAVVFSKEGEPQSSGSVNIPGGVSLVVLANLPPGQVRNLSAGGGLTITTPNRTASSGNTTPETPNSHGRLVVGVSGAGTLSFS